MNLLITIIHSFVGDYTFEIHRRNVNDKDVYTIPFKVGTNPGRVVDLALATNSEWTYITGRNCTHENGCARGVYNHYTTDNENVNWTLLHQTVRKNIQIKSSILRFQRPTTLPVSQQRMCLDTEME